MIWPENVPRWCRELENNIYAQHSYGEKDKLYEKGVFPIGPNFWIRKEILTEKGYSYDESIGPIPDPKKRIMGSETTFLKMLADNGYQIMHVASSSLGHYVTEEQTTPNYLRIRASTHGRLRARISPNFDKAGLYKRSLLMWKAYKMIAVLWHVVACGIAALRPNPSKRYLRQIEACRWKAYNETYIKYHKEIWAEKMHSLEKKGCS